MKRVVFITPEGAWPGFQLAGMEQMVTTKAGAPQVLRQQADDPATGLVVLDDRLSSEVSEELLARLDRHHPGKITILPSPHPGERNFALDIIRQAIGYHVRFKG